MVVANITKEKIICRNVKIANSFLTRLQGLLGSKGLSEDEGLLIVPCKWVHTFGMKYSIDIVFVDKNGRVVGVQTDLKPQKISKFYYQAKKVLELKAGRIAQTGLEPGDYISIE